MRAIDADRFLNENCGAILWGEYKSCEECHKDYEACMLEISGDDIMNAPTIDAVEVVRCGECQYYDEDNNECDLLLMVGEERKTNEIIMFPDDYCSWGERKDEAEDGRCD